MTTTITKVKTFMIRLHDSYRIRDESELNDFLKAREIKRIDSSLVNVGTHGAAWSVLIFYEETSTGNRSAFSQPSDFGISEEVTPIPLDAADEILYEALRTWRNQRAANLGLAPFILFSNAMLKNIVRKKPKTS
ncbi:MAG: HRDC domain-containing protein [Chloroflexota bacterium]